MNRAPLIFLGVFFALAFSWTGIVVSNQISYGNLTPYYAADEGKLYPEAIPGIAARGKLVYEDLGCIYCHTQQVRRPGFGADDLRGWGRSPKRRPRLRAGGQGVTRHHAHRPRSP